MATIAATIVRAITAARRSRGVAVGRGTVRLTADRGGPGFATAARDGCTAGTGPGSRAIKAPTWVIPIFSRMSSRSATGIVPGRVDGGAAWASVSAGLMGFQISD